MINSSNKKQCCIAPEGNWKEFIVLNYSQYMTDKKEETPKEEASATNEEEQENEKAA